MRAIVNKRINTRWFHRVLEDNKISVREYDRMTKQSTGTSSRLFRGRRHFGFEDAETFVRVTGANLVEVLKNAGLEMENAQNTQTVEIAGWIDATRRLHTPPGSGRRDKPSAQSKGSKFALAPPDATDATLAYRYWCKGSMLEVMHGAVIYFRPLGPITPVMLDRWCVVRLADNRELVRIVHKGSKGKYRLCEDERDTGSDAAVKAAAVAEWVKF